MTGRLTMLLAAALALGLSACIEPPAQRQSRWDAYYARTDTPLARVMVAPPEGTTVPMSKLIARYVADALNKQNIEAQVAQPKPGPGRYFVLSGVAEDVPGESGGRYRRVLRWMLSDAGGRLISSHTQGVEGTQEEWDFGSARLLSAIGADAAGPVAQMVRTETKAKVALDPLRQGLLIGTVDGLAPADSDALTAAVKEALRTTDVQVTGDERQAAFRLAGRVETTPAENGTLNVRLTWTVTTMDHDQVGSAVQENRVAAEDIVQGWGQLAPRVGQAAAVGVEHIFGARSGPPPGAANRAAGAPPVIVLPGEPGRAPPPPQ